MLALLMSRAEPPKSPTRRAVQEAPEPIETITFGAFIFTIGCLISIVLLPIGLLLLSQRDGGRNE